MRRYLTEQTLELGQEVTLTGDSFHHIHVVCRRDVGHAFELLNSDQGHAFLVKVKSVSKNSMVVSVLETRPLPELKPPFIHLVLNYPKPKVFEAVVEKAVELGVSSIHPMLSDYSFFRTSEKLKDKDQRWNKIVHSAMQQSGRFEPLKIAPVKPLKDFLAEEVTAFVQNPGRHLAIAFYEGEAPLMGAYFQSQIQDWAQVQNIWVFVGSEGGFSTQEVQAFKQHNITSLSLGDQVLRVETACVSIVSVLRYMSGAF